MIRIAEDYLDKGVDFVQERMGQGPQNKLVVAVMISLEAYLFSSSFPRDIRLVFLETIWAPRAIDKKDTSRHACTR